MGEVPFTALTMLPKTPETIRADPLGIVPTYCRRRGRCCGVAVSQTGITKLVSPEEPLDPLGLAMLLTLGFCLGDRTVFRDIRRLDAGETVSVLDGQRIGVVRPVLPTAKSPTDTELRELFHNAVRRYSSDVMPIVPLSGGRDSRLILLGLRSLGIRPRVVLTGGGLRGTPDGIVATRLARTFGEPIEGVTPVTFDLKRELWRHQVQNFESLEHGWFLGIALRARALGGPVTDGVGLGVLATGSLMKPEAIALWRVGALDELAEWTVAHAAGVGSDFLEKLAHAGVPLSSTDEVRHEIVYALRALGHLPNPLGAFSLLHWTRRGISASPFGLLDQSRTFAPLCDEHLAAATLSIELRHAVESDWRERLLSQFDTTGIPFSDDPSVNWPESRAQGGLVQRVLGRVEWARLCARFQGDLRDLAAHVPARGGLRRSFQRSSLGLLAALETVRNPNQRDYS
jgi:asparagine synthase (glutamine-hydrolysing)